MRLGLRWNAWALVLGASVVFGCGGGGAPPPPSDGGLRDSGVRDAGLPDGSPTTDGGDASVGDGGAGTCGLNLATDVISLGSEGGFKDRHLAMAPAPDGVMVLWARNNDVFSRLIPSSGTVPAEQMLTGGIALSRDPAVARVGSGYLAAWVDNDNAAGGSGYEVRARPLNADGSTAGSVVTITNNMLTEESLAMAPFGSGALLVWTDVAAGTALDGGTPSHTLHSLALDASGNPAGTVQDLRSDPSLGRPAVAATTDGAVVAWTESSAGDAGAGARVALQHLNTSDAPTGAVVFVDSGMNASGAVDLATASNGGAVVFGVAVSGTRPEVRWHALTDVGAPTGPEVPVSLATTTATDPSMAPFRGGFALAFRVLTDPAATLAVPLIRLVVVDNAGARISSLDLAETLADGARTTIGVGLDGNPVIGWTEMDTNMAQTRVQVARLRCGS